MDVNTLLAAHAARYGSQAAVHAALPKIFDLGSREDYGIDSGPFPDWQRDHKARLSVSVDRYREEQLVNDEFAASGRDSLGAWSLTRYGGFVRLTVEEDDLAIKAWVLRREYLSSVMCGRDEVACGPQCEFEVTVHDERLRSPTLRFDSASSSLESVLYQRADGQMLRWRLHDWVEDTDGRAVSWPSDMSDDSDVYDLGTFRWSNPSGPSVSTCEPLVSMGATASGCFDAIGSPVTTEWSKTGPVRLPLVSFDNSQAVRTRGGVVAIEPMALFSMASSALRGATFTPDLPLKPLPEPCDNCLVGVRIHRNGRLALPIEDLLLRDVRGVLFDRPMRDVDGVLAWNALTNVAVRVDFARQEVIFATDAKGLRAPNAVHVPLRIAGDLRVVAVSDPVFEVLRRDPRGAHASILPFPPLKQLSGCAAVTLDIAARSMWIEPPCAASTVHTSPTTPTTQ